MDTWKNGSERTDAVREAKKLGQSEGGRACYRGEPMRPRDARDIPGTYAAPEWLADLIAAEYRAAYARGYAAMACFVEAREPVRPMLHWREVDA